MEDGKITGKEKRRQRRSDRLLRFFDPLLSDVEDRLAGAFNLKLSGFATFALWFVLFIVFITAMVRLAYYLKSVTS